MRCGKQFGKAENEVLELVTLIVDWFDDALGEALYSSFSS
jgi:hypothetical protein